MISCKMVKHEVLKHTGLIFVNSNYLRVLCMLKTISSCRTNKKCTSGKLLHSNVASTINTDDPGDVTLTTELTSWVKVFVESYARDAQYYGAIHSINL